LFLYNILKIAIENILAHKMSATSPPPP